MATPVYFYTMCGQMKTFIDRVCDKYTQINNKDFYFIATAADGNKNAANRTIKEFRGFTYCLNGPKEKGIISAVGVRDKGDIINSKFMNEAHTMRQNA